MNLEDDYNSSEMREDNDSMWHDNMNRYEGPDYDYSENSFQNQGGFQRGGGYGMNGPPPFFGPHGPPGRSGPPFMWGRGFGPAGPPTVQRFKRDNNPISYLMRCGIPKQHLKSLPRPLLNLMEPEYCGVCAMHFDNFAASSLHYISKNHTKSQKKWIAQQSKIAYNNPKELPIKSREVYCELCDVQITSKNHADSHYAGKLHRATVEGRKNPKNPFLLQRGMEARVQRLIRREKKFLKPFEEVEATELMNDSKPSLPELYCQICKTSVTCTEQMTMHLNGKKHLNKEKQHILKMMKGETTKTEDNPVPRDNDQAEAAEDDEYDDVEEAAASTGKNEEAQDEYDWGNGSGTWDDADPQ